MIYFIEAVGTDWVKIGQSGNPADRFRDLQVASPHELKFMLVAEGSGREELRLHSILRFHRVRGEWFERSAVAPVVRLIRRKGMACLADLERLQINLRKEALRDVASADRVAALCERRLARHVLRTIPAEQSKSMTRITHRAWRKTLTGETRLSGRALVHSLSYAPQYFSRAVKARTGKSLVQARPVVARYQGIIAEADAMRVPS